jgi:hypothetical protein
VSNSQRGKEINAKRYNESVPKSSLCQTTSSDGGGDDDGGDDGSEGGSGGYVQAFE